MPQKNRAAPSNRSNSAGGIPQIYSDRSGGGNVAEHATRRYAEFGRAIIAPQRSPNIEAQRTSNCCNQAFTLITDCDCNGDFSPTTSDGLIFIKTVQFPLCACSCVVFGSILGVCANETTPPWPARASNNTTTTSSGHLKPHRSSRLSNGSSRLA